jgi:hypothetical protein
MKREGGLWATAAVLGIVATVGTSTPQPKPSPAPGILQSTESSSSVNLLAMQSIDKGPCGDLEKRLQSFLLVDESEIVAPASCYPGERQPAPSQKLLIRATQLRFIIATLPDPLHTHFPLSFDRSAEAIQQAAQDDRYIYDSSWLPWETEQSSYARIGDQDQAETRTEQHEDQPGVLLFRRSLHGNHAKHGAQDELNDLPFETGLAVLIVGEEPTGGIHRRQFENAVQWIQALQASNKGDLRVPLQILGPTFSGSIPSLVELLRNTVGIHAEHNAPLRIFSGTVTSDVLVNWLKNAATLDPGSSGIPDLRPLGIQFRSFTHSGNVNIERYCSYLYATGSELARLAIVSEDETAFGGEYGKGDTDSSPCRPEPAKPGQPPNQGPVHLYYPRDISALRAAYQSQSIFSRTTAQANGDALHRTLQDDLADPKRKDHDTIRTYSDNQNSLSQEAELQQLVSLMRAHKTQFILLRSSNPLDLLFLSQYFRMTYPEGRIVLAGADLLLRRETGASGLNGVMTLSTYPLLPWEQDWTKTPSTGRFHSHRAFTNDAVEGTYFAARFLLWPTAPDAMTSKEARDATASADGEASADAGFVPSNCIPALNLPDYAPPFWMKPPNAGPCHHPPTWISVLGNGGFWPVAVLDFPIDLTQPRKPPRRDALSARLWHSVTAIGTSIAFLFGYDHGRQAAGRVPQAWLPMPLSMRLLMLAGVIWAAFHALCCCRASITVKPAHRAHFVPPNSLQAQTACDEAFLRHQQNSHRALVLFGSILVALLPITLAWGYGEMWEGGEPLPNPWRYRLFLPLIWLTAGGAVCANTWIEDHLFFRPRLPETKVPPAVWRSLLWFTGVSLILYWCLEFCLDFALTDFNRIPTYWRAINLTTGVSPLVPLVALIAGLYGWFWYSLQGLALFGEDRPQLPKAESLRIIQSKQEGNPEERLDDVLRMLSREGAAKAIEKLSSPFALKAWRVVGACLATIFVMALVVFGYPPIRTLGTNAYSFVFGFWLVLCISMLLANAWQLSQLWLTLRHMLQFLDKLPLRRTLAGFQGFSWGSVWKMGGSVLDMRYKLVFRQMESLTHLRSSLLEWKEKQQPGVANPAICDEIYDTEQPGACGWIKLIDETRQERVKFAGWYSQHWDDPKERRVLGLNSLQQSLAETAAIMITQLLIPSWRGESESLTLSPSEKVEPSDGDRKDKADPNAASVACLPRHVRNAEELVCLVYMAFIQNVLGRLRSLVMGIICMFIAIAVAIASYPFDPRPLLSGIVVILFLILGITIVAVYSQMHRDTTLSNLTSTTPGELGSDFWFKLIGFGVGPALGLIASVFPEFTEFLFSWVQPSLGSVK